MPVKTSTGPEMGVVLIVEDDEELREAFVLSVRDAGFVVESADSVRAALLLLRGIHVDLVLTDYALPDGTGLEMLARAQAEGLLERTAVILCTAARDVIAPAGVVLLHKPVALEDLLLAIASRAQV